MDSNKVVFFALGKKAYESLRAFLDHFSVDCILHVVIGRDSGVEDDFYPQISSLCAESGILFYERLAPETYLTHSGYSFSIGWRWMIKDSQRLIVFHDSLLPKYRGFAPLVNMLINGEQRLGVTALLASEDYDRGDILDAKSIPVTYPVKIHEAIELVVPLYQDLVVSSYHKLLSGSFEAVPQIEDDASYSLWRNEDDYIVDWSLDALYISRFCDAVGPPYGGAKTSVGGKVIRILDVCPLADVTVEDRPRHIGKVIFFKEGNPVVICGSGLLEVRSMVMDGSVEVPDISFRTRFKWQWMGS